MPSALNQMALLDRRTMQGTVCRAVAFAIHPAAHPPLRRVE
jgi:hypothetical protein